MHVMYFSEQPMSPYPKEEADKLGYSALLFSNEHFDPAEGSRLYNEYIEDFVAAEAVGFDGVMLNEHHKIVLLGNPLPLQTPTPASGCPGCRAGAQRCIELLGEEVLPAVRQIDEDLGLKSPFEVSAPTGLAHPQPAQPRLVGVR